VLIFLVTLFGVPTFLGLLAGAPILQFSLVVVALLFLAGLSILLWLLEKNSLRDRHLRVSRRINRGTGQITAKTPDVVRVAYLPDKREVYARKNQSILQTSLLNGIPHTHVCGGNARCSTCRVMILEGMENLKPRTPAEIKLTEKLLFNPRVRLACQAVITGNVKVRRLVLDYEDEQLTNQIKRGVKPTAVGREITAPILFADIVGFTNFAERNLPYDVIHALNRYYRRMGRVINAHGGKIFNYMGDGMMALFGIEGQAEAAINSVRAGLEMLLAIEDLRPYFDNIYAHGIDIRIGIHFGHVVIGNLGSEDHKHLTAIGDSVNFASRIENANKDADTRLLISEDLYQRVKNNVQTRVQFPYNPKGKTGDYNLFEVVAVKKVKSGKAPRQNSE
ncbi:MAG: adenylate/guanylate cyclase domain-containing protein, partial [Chloroflexota bacterium]